jgi:hypothetical protein
MRKCRVEAESASFLTAECGYLECDGLLLMSTAPNLGLIRNENAAANSTGRKHYLDEPLPQVLPNERVHEPSQKRHIARIALKDAHCSAQI